MVEWMPSAKRHLSGIFEHISKNSIYYAHEMVEEFLEESAKLDQFPMAGRMVPEFNETNVREVFIYSYRLMYRITSKQIEVVAIIHGKRHFQPELDV